MATYPVEFHRRLEQKWESRIDQIFEGGRDRVRQEAIDGLPAA